MIEVPDWTRPHMATNYPPSNLLPFEEWLTQQTFPKLEREFLPIHLTSYWVNNSYGNDLQAKQRMQEFFDGLDRNKKYWVAVQYDDQLVIDKKDLDLVVFGMSYRLPEQKPDYVIPLIGHMCEFDFKYLPKQYKASFVGNLTHPIRTQLIDVISRCNNYLYSTKPHEHGEYNLIMAESYFTLCPRGYGVPSFRAFEAIHNGSIPIYISDEFMEPYGIDFNEYGVKVHQFDLPLLPEIISSISTNSIEQKKRRMNELYRYLCTYEGIYDYIIKTLKNEI